LKHIEAVVLGAGLFIFFSGVVN